VFRLRSFRVACVEQSVERTARRSGLSFDRCFDGRHALLIAASLLGIAVLS
jgi:hypothetical protein